MANYIKGLGGKCCDSCLPDDPCKAKPKFTTCGSGTAYVGIPGTWSAVASGQFLTGATWTMGAFDGLSITSAGFITGTVPTGPTGTYAIPVTATNACGSATCDFVLTLDSGLCHLTLDTAGGDAGYDHTFDTSGDFISTRDIYVDFESYSVKDRLLISANGSVVYDSGCIGAHVTPTITIPAGTTTVRVQVLANCEGTTGTLWTLGITCAPL